MVGLIILICMVVFSAIGVFYMCRTFAANDKMTEIELKRFKEFQKGHLFAYTEYKYPPECGYTLYAKAFFSEDKEDITDYDFMINNI